MLSLNAVVAVKLWGPYRVSTDERRKVLSYGAHTGWAQMKEEKSCREF
jgi:hypothetical protein